jgi:hypothetical protein
MGREALSDNEPVKLMTGSRSMGTEALWGNEPVKLIAES